MPRAVPYRRFHRFHGDVLVVAGITVAGWFLWPLPPPESDRPKRTPPVAYGEIDRNAIGSILYPGHFAFSSNIGFGLMSDLSRKGSPRWSVAGAKPFLEPMEVVELPSRFPPASEPSLETMPNDLPPLRAGNALLVSPLEPPSGLRSGIAEAQFSEALMERSFNAPLLQDALVNAAISAGDIGGYLSLTSQGRVSGILFLENSIPWSALRPIEDALLRGVADAADEPVGGWVWIRWQHAAIAERGRPSVP